jgi:sec-independent protein translocase protein TatA
VLSGFENPTHLAILLVVVLLLFGAKRLPDVGRGLGEGIHGFRKALIHSDDDSSEVES